MMNLPRYIRTLRHLRMSQLVGQVRIRISALWMDPSAVKSRGWRLNDRQLLLNLSAPVPAQDAGALAAGRFEFVGHRVDLGSSPDWLAPGQSKLWKYNLHYFDWLWSLLDAREEYWESARRLTMNWIEQHRPTKGACGWEPYPTSLRLMNWCLLFGLKNWEKLAIDPTFRDALLDSIGRQAAWLERNLETHIQANHLLENLCALLCVASVLKGPDSIRLQKRYQPRIAHEIQEQILPDGMHYERSPMYHLRVMWLMEMLKEVGDSGIQAVVEAPLNRAKIALSSLRHPDGEIAQLNDAAIGIYADLWPLQTLDGGWSLAKAGYYGYRNGGDYLVIDSGPVGPDHQPGHAHADLLSIELSLSGQRVITDTGIGTYEIGEERTYDRSTAGHSTLEIAGQNSVEVWGSFRVGRRVSPKILRWEPSDKGFLLEAEHHGYAHLQGRPVHRRAFEWKDGVLEIRDQVWGGTGQSVAIRFQLAPEVEATIKERNVECRIGDLRFGLFLDGPGELSLERAHAYPQFGIRQERAIAVVRHDLTSTRLEWRFQLRMF